MRVLAIVLAIVFSSLLVIATFVVGAALASAAPRRAAPAGVVAAPL